MDFKHVVSELYMLLKNICVYIYIHIYVLNALSSILNLQL